MSESNDPKKHPVRNIHLPATDKYPALHVRIHDMPEKPTRIEERDGRRYFFDDAGRCYGSEGV